ncbi:MAG: S41 family peptidase [Armatimonadetes bacterium]|nr:S41 family peptidase [Armatimonadota bacterium]
MPAAVKRYFAILVLPSVLLLWLSTPAGARLGQEELEKIHAIAAVVQQRYYQQVTAAEVLRAAARGLRQELESQGVAPGFSVDQVSSVGAFDRCFLECSAAHPRLARTGRLTEVAIQGMLQGLRDPYSAYLSPKAFEEYVGAMGGTEAGGVGLLIDQREDTREVVVLDVIENSPAMHRGVRTGDVMLTVDGARASDLGYQEVRKRLRGDAGSLVRLELRRGGRSLPVELTRSTVHLRSVLAELLTDGERKVGYLRVRLFGAETAGELRDAMRGLEAAGARAYILDLRNNGGGYLQTAVEVCSAFLPSETLVVSVRERNRPERVHYSNASAGTAHPLVVLINEHSASASEVTAAALREQGRAMLVGTRSFGKGSVQKLIRLKDDSALKLTTAHYFTPRGADLDKVGLQPDLVFQMPLGAIGTTSDVQLTRALELLGNPLAAADRAIRGSTLK